MFDKGIRQFFAKLPHSPKGPFRSRSDRAQTSCSISNPLGEPQVERGQASDFGEALQGVLRDRIVVREQSRFQLR
jgi:hypothetical protein